MRCFYCDLLISLMPTIYIVNPHDRIAHGFTIVAGKRNRSAVSQLLTITSMSCYFHLFSSKLLFLHQTHNYGKEVPFCWFLPSIYILSLYCVATMEDKWLTSAGTLLRESSWDSLHPRFAKFANDEYDV